MNKKLFFAEYRTHPIVATRFLCHSSPKGSVGYDHQYHGFNMGTLGNVITLFGPQGMRHFNFKSANIHLVSYSSLPKARYFDPKGYFQKQQKSSLKLLNIHATNPNFKSTINRTVSMS